MNGENNAAIDLQGTSIPIPSEDMGILIPPNSRELAMSREGTTPQGKGTGLMGYSDVN